MDEIPTTMYAKAPADIRAVAEHIAENFGFDPNVLAGAVCAALLSEREAATKAEMERCAGIADYTAAHSYNGRALALNLAEAIRSGAKP